MRKILWMLFWVYQVAGAIAAAYYWEEIVEHYHLVKTLTESFLTNPSSFW